LFFTPQGGAEKSMNEFREGTYTPLRGVRENGTGWMASSAGYSHSISDFIPQLWHYKNEWAAYMRHPAHFDFFNEFF
jgi:hypothetical protein